MSLRPFILKSLAFISPVLILYIVAGSFYSYQAGDLARIGYLPYDKQYYAAFQDAFNQEIKYKPISNFSLKDSKTSVLIIGDSFAGQGAYGFKNYLAQNESMDVYYVPELFSNPIQT